MTPIPVRTAAAAAAAVLALTACGGATSDPGSSEAAGQPSAPASDASEAPIAGTTVTLLTHDSFNASEEVLAAFEAETGMTLEILRAGDAGAMVNQAILTAGNPQADVLFGIDNTFLTRALDADLFVPYEAAGLDAVPEPYWALDPDFNVAPIDAGDVCLNYDRDAYDELEVPFAFDDLVDPEYAGDLVVENPATSSPGLAFLLATIARYGEDGYLDFWADLVANDVAISAGWEDAYYGQFSGGSGEGDRPLVVSYASSPAAEVYYAEPQPDDAPTGVIEDTCFRQVEFAGILRGTDNEAGARALIEFLLSREFQEDIPLNMFVFPVRTDADLPDVFVRHAAIVEEPNELDSALIAAKRDEWIEAWTEVVLR